MKVKIEADFKDEDGVKTFLTQLSTFLNGWSGARLEVELHLNGAGKI